MRYLKDLNLSTCINSLKRGWRLIVLLTMVGCMFGSLAAMFIADEDDVYYASASVYSFVYGSFADSEEAVSAVRLYSDIIKSMKVAETARLLLGDNKITKEDIYDNMTVDAVVTEGTTYVYENTSPVIRMHYEDIDKAKAIRIVNAIADAFVLEINGVTDSDAIQVLDYAYDAEKSYNAVQTQIILVCAATILGMMFALFILLCRVFFTTKIVSVIDVSHYDGLPIVGAIPRF